MTEGVADIAERIGGIRQLGAVVNAMRGIASARARQAREQLLAVDGYEATIVSAIAGLLETIESTSTPSLPVSSPRATPPVALVVFCAEQGFAGAFSERVFDSLRGDGDGDGDGDGVQRYVIGSRGVALAAARGIAVRWSSPMPSHSPGVVRLADRIADALYRQIENDEPERIDVVFTDWRPGEGASIVRHRLLPLDAQALARAAAAGPAEPRSPTATSPMANLPPARLLAELTEDYVFARLCNAALHAFAAENEARIQAMASAHRQVERQLAELEARQRRVRQEAITAEIIELAAGETASRQNHHPTRRNDP